MTGNILIAFVRIYRMFISPMFPPSCRYSPTCSMYMEEALSKYGIIKGLFKGAKRLLHCHPYSEGGYDPVK